MAETDLPVFGAVEDLMLGILRPWFQGHAVSVETTYHTDMRLPCVVPLHANHGGLPSFDTNDNSLTVSAMVEMNTFTEGLEAERDGAQLQEACKHALIQAQRKQLVVPGVGVINRINASSMASQKSDWATSTGVVQYETLPLGVVRYEAVYRLLLRPVKSALNSNPYLTPAD